MNKLILYLLGMSLMSCHISNKEMIKRYFEQTEDSVCLASYEFLVENTTKNQLDFWVNNYKDLVIDDITLAVVNYRSIQKEYDIPFSVFCEYVLPIQIDQEPLENWRENCLDIYGKFQGMPIEFVCDTLNHILGENFGFSLQSPSSPNMSWSHLDTLQKGDCFHMAKSVLYPLRALGYPTTIDFVPCWGNTTGAHSWNVIYVDGKMIPFMGREAGIYEYDPFCGYDFQDSIKMKIANPFRYPAKVYRKKFSINKRIKELTENKGETDIPPFMRDSRIQDVSAEYFPVTDIQIVLNASVIPLEPIYLAVYSNDWTITAYPENQDEKQAFFKDVKTEMLYMPVVFRKGKVIPVDQPFVVDKTGKKCPIVLTGQKDTCRISYLLPMRQDLSQAVANKDNLTFDIFDRIYTGEKRTKPITNKEYSLYCWEQDHWGYVESVKAVNGKLLFTHVPQGGLLFLAEDGDRFIGRCFTYENGEMNWW